MAVGGATKNRFWMQNKADVTGRVIETSAIDEATARGAALLTGIGLGIYRDEKEAFESTYKKGDLFVPDPDAHNRYDDHYGVYKKLYPALKDLNHEIFGRPAR